MKPILTRWIELQSKIHEFHNPKSPYKHNVKMAIQYTQELGKHIQEHMPTIETWLHTYLDTNRKEICIRYWLETANEYFLHWLDKKCDDGHISSRIHEWDAMLEAEDINMRFDQAKKIVKETIHHMDPDLCDDPDILQIHKDKPCVSNGWYCDLCYDLEFAWKAKLVQQLTQSEHVLLNRSLHDEVCNRAKQTAQIPPSWVFPKIYNGLYSHSETPIETRDDMVQAANKRRSVYKKQGKTPFQACEEFLSIVYSLDSGWFLQQWQIDTDWKMFRHCMNKMEVVSYVVPLDLVRAREIEDML